MTAGYSSKSLKDKLGIKPGQQVLFKNAPKEFFEELGKLPETVFVAKKLNRPMDYIHCFYDKAADINKDTILFQQYLEPNGMLWISWPKKASKVPTDITEQTLRDVLLPLNLVDIKVAAVTDVWSGLKFVWMKK